MDKKSTKDQNTGRAFMDIVGSAHYSYAGKYLADFSLSASDSSLLKPGNRWGVFPSVGAGWVLSEENFIKARGSTSSRCVHHTVSPVVPTTP